MVLLLLSLLIRVKYNVKAVYVGYNKKETQGVQVFADKTAYVNMGLVNDGGVQLDEVQIISYTEPLIID